MTPRTRYALCYLPSKAFYVGLGLFMWGVGKVFGKPKN